MSGFFGGYLYLVELIGGITLYVLIGRKAWAKSEDGLFNRLAIGSVTIGTIIGGLIGSWLSGPTDPRWLIFLAFGGIGAMISCVVTYILERIRRGMSE